MTPIEKMAALLLARHKLYPPYDLDDLAGVYGDVEYLDIPFEVDGIAIGIGGGETPQIIINGSAPSTRKKFTLAHELGHIVIPWHIGTIFSHIDSADLDLEYREMESEANQFASELLIPRSWLLGVQDNFSSFASFVEHVLESTGASRDAVLIKIFNTIELPIICSQVDVSGEILSFYQSKTAPTGATLVGKNINVDSLFPTAGSEESFYLGDRSYRSWSFFNSEIVETDSRPWRDILVQILKEADSKDLQLSINAVLPSQYSSHKEKPVDQICSKVMHTYGAREKFKSIMDHPLLPQYVIKRIKELVAKNEHL